MADRRTGRAVRWRALALTLLAGGLANAYLAPGILTGGDQTALRDPDKREAFTRGWARFNP